MTVLSRRAFLALAAGGLVLGTGCGGPGSVAYFLMPEQRLDAKIKHLASTDPKKESRVVILTYGGFETRAEFIHADRQLAEFLGQHLKALTEGTEEKISIVPGRKVEEFKNSNPSWKSMPLAEIGRKLAADHVIYLEITQLTLYETGSLNTLLRGRTNISISLCDVAKPDDTPAQETFSCIYPGDAPGPIPVGADMQPMQFRQKFLNHAARQLSYYFSRYPRNERYRME